MSTTFVKTFRCPSNPDSGNTTAVTYTLPPYGTYQVATGDYGPLRGVNTALATAVGIPTGNLNGILQIGKEARIAEVTDGLSNTTLIVEIAGRSARWRAGTRDSAPQTYYTGSGGWNDSSTGNAALYGSAANGTADGSTVCGTQPCTPLPSVFTCVVNCSNDYGLYAFHTGIANLGMGDGSVRTIQASASPKVVASMVTRANGEVISE